MSLLDKIKEIPIINDHTHIFGCGKPEYERAGDFARNITAEGIVTGLSGMNMMETAAMAEKDGAKLNDLWLKLYQGRRTTFPARLLTRFYREVYGFDGDEITLDNAGPLVAKMKSVIPVGTDAFHEYLAKLTNTEVWFANHGGVDDYDERTTRGRFRWVPYVFPSLAGVRKWAEGLGLEPPNSADKAREVMVAKLRQAKERGVVAIKSGAFAYDLDRPFAPDVESLKRADSAITRLDADKDDAAARRTIQDAFMILCAQAAGEVGLPVQVHVGLIWTAMGGPTRIPEIMDMTPVFYICPETTFVIFHAGYPRTDDLAHVAATMSNVRAEFNWAPFWAGVDFPRMLGKWIDMIPCDRIIYGTDAGGLCMSMHDVVSREGLAEALGERVRRGLLSERIAVEIAANILRNNAIETYGLKQ